MIHRRTEVNAITDRQHCSLIKDVVPYDFSFEVRDFYLQDQPRRWLSQEREFGR